MRNINWFAVVFITALVAIALPLPVLSNDVLESADLSTPSESPEDLVTLFKRQQIPPRVQTSRGAGLCMISPGVNQRLEVWSDPPQFIWRGAGHTLRVLDLTTETQRAQRNYSVFSMPL